MITLNVKGKSVSVDVPDDTWLLWTLRDVLDYSGVPACSVPAGLVRGLPVGLQIVAPRCEEARVLRFAAEVEHLGNPLY